MADESNLSKDPNGSERPEAEKENIRNPDLQVEAPSLLSSFWWSSLYETAKSKSSAVLNSVKKDITELTETFQQDAATAFQFIKRDLTEFSETVQHDTASAVASTASLLRDKLQVDNTESVAGKAKEGITSLLENITDVFMPYQEPDEEEVVIIHNSKPLILDRWESQLHAIRVDPKTYCREPESPPELYETWLEVFDLNAHQEEISKIMVECGQVRNLYAKLVPTAVSHNEFWQRYFFRVQQLKEAEIKRAELVQRANQQLPSEDLDWGDGKFV
ncbi:BSD domain-containing protein 1-like isoform X2 [Tachypleus tridentatus]|uniref:BSD domain-containing protein 1-like isoform X2 n=1 Tax=Tachypleus tridentatus TaxID=6853 RepID=UPI003FD47E51